MSQPSFVYLEDDSNSRKVMLILLKNVMGYSNLTVFEDSANLMEKLQVLSTVPTVLFVDIQIEPQDGFQILQMVKDEPRYRDTVVIALTSSVTVNDVNQLKARGFDGLIGKPLLDDVFPELVERILSGEQVWYIP